jgi:hypothetical protein
MQFIKSSLLCIMGQDLQTKGRFLSTDWFDRAQPH